MISKFRNSMGLLKKLKYTVKNSERMIQYQLRAHELLTAAQCSQEELVSSKSDFGSEVVVSLTTYDKRIFDVHLVIESIARQTLKPNRLILWLDEGEFTINSIPYILKRQLDRGLEIKFCKNLRSYKKLIPTLKLCPTSSIVTIDDDVLYPYDMLELLVRESQAYPGKVIAHRAHKIELGSNGRAKKYSEWQYETNDNIASELIFPVGVGGVFYPVGTLDSACLDDGVFMEICPTADDVWFKAASLSKGVLCKKVSDPREFWNRFLLIDSVQDVGLFKSNVQEKGNDRQVEAVFDHFNLIPLLQKN